MKRFLPSLLTLSLLAACSPAGPGDDVPSVSSSSSSSSAVASSAASSAHSLIFLDSPQAGDTVASPLTVTGEARGNWYFEATFPVKLLDANGGLVVQHYAEAQNDWMTTDFVPYVATLTFTPPATATGTLVLEKANASGLPANDDSVEIPVQF